MPPLILPYIRAPLPHFDRRSRDRTVEGARMRPALDIVPRDFALGDAVPGVPVDVAWEPQVRGPRRVLANWNQYMAMASRVVGRFHGQFALKRFDYEHPSRLQPNTPRRLKRPYRVSVAYTEWGSADAPV